MYFLEFDKVDFFQIVTLNQERAEFLPSLFLTVLQMKLFKSPFILILFFAVSTIGYSQNADSTKTDELDEIVVTAQYAPQSAQASVYKVKVITQGEIKTKGATNMRELLNQELGINLEQNSVFGSSIDIQGISGENVKILIDGTPVTGRLNGIVDLNQLQLSDVARVEIIEGPTSVYYGTDALAGVINIITKRHQKKNFDGYLTSYYESVGQFNVNAKTGYRAEKDEIQLSGGRNYFGGYSENDTTRQKDWEGREQYFAKLYYAHQFKKLMLSNSTNFFTEELIKLDNPTPANTAKDIYYNTRRWNNDLDISGYISDNNYIDVVFSFSDYFRYNNTYVVDLETGTQELSDKARDHDTTGFNQWFFKGQYSNSAHKNLSYAVGYDIIYETAEGKRILNNHQTMGNYAVFGSMNFTAWEKLIIQPSLRYTYNSSFNAPVSPALNLKYNFNNNASLRASYARGYRAPSIKELYLEFVVSAGPNTFYIYGNPNLEAENSHNVNLSYSQIINIGEKQKLTVDPSLFFNDITNMIALSDMVNFERHYINIDKHKTYGGKLEMSYSPINTLKISAGVFQIASYNNFSESNNVPDYVFTTDFNARVSYRLPKQKLTFAVYYKYNGAKPGFTIEKPSGNIVETYIEDYQILDASASMPFFNNRLNLTLGGKNLLDVKNIATVGKQSGQPHSTDLALWGRTFFVKLQFNFRKG